MKVKTVELSNAQREWMSSMLDGQPRNAKGINGYRVLHRAGLIEAVPGSGFRLTPAGQAALAKKI